MNSISKYPIYDISEVLDTGSEEFMGTKPKEWVTYSLDGKKLRMLYKEGRPGTGENWSEKVTSELALLLGFPCAVYDLAFLAKDRPCVISPIFVYRDEGEELIHGNQLIEGFEKSECYNNPTYTLNGIFEALHKNQVHPLWVSPDGKMISDASDVFIGYLCFDAWVGNTDRHEENWGILTKKTAHNLTINVLAPTFDHASSLGREQSDEKRIKRMQSKDKGYNISAYVQNAMSPIYDESGNMLSNISVVNACRILRPDVTDYWIGKICALMQDSSKIRSILEKVPDKFISEPARDFAMAFLNESTSRLRSLQK